MPSRAPSLDRPLTATEIAEVDAVTAALATVVAAGPPPAIGGYLRVRSAGRTRTLLLGSRTVAGAVLDWRTAPLAEVFFRQRAGDDYELEIDDRTVTGLVLARGRVRVVGGALVELTTEDAILAREGDGWRARAIPTRARPAATSAGKAEVVLDAEQRRAVELPATTSLVVDGEAGVGKTLVALHRIAWLQAQSERRLRVLVLVPTPGLRQLCRQLIDRLGLERVEVAVVDEWLLARGRAAFAGLPERLADDAEAQVIRLKRHPAVRGVLPDLIARPKSRDDGERKWSRARRDLLHLWGDRPRLEAIVAAARGALPPLAIALTTAHTRGQFESTTEEAHRHVDADRLVALDGRALDDGTPTARAGTIDAEDVPVLFAIAALRDRPKDREALAALPRYDHVVVDEAQLIAPMELAAIGGAIGRGGAITLAGDHRQDTDDSSWFAGWPAAMAEVGVERYEAITLMTTYRSVPAITAFARGLAAARGTATPIAPGDALWAGAFASELDQVAEIAAVIDAARAEDRGLTIAILGRNAAHARRLHRDLTRGLDVTLVERGAFPFAPGVIVTAIAEISGLEFDAVVIPDLTPEFYPAQTDAARALYVAATRARTWLWLTTVGEWSPLVAAP
ncbi:MAG: ATP-binding domain-containing protein [Deltaproteobacteria bacterium]|nr:ATP-binding domain-containing protein [Deltaproteobacteria bacterium]